LAHYALVHVAERSSALLARDPAGRARAIAWMFVALNSVEIQGHHVASLDASLCRGEACPAFRRALADQLAPFASNACRSSTPFGVRGAPTDV